MIVEQRISISHVSQTMYQRDRDPLLEEAI
jgi:hypothetical protein